MTKYLVIVESPTKAKTLGKFLGKDYVIESSIGHIRDLPANASEIPKKFKKESWARLGVDVDNDFKPLYVVQPSKKKKIQELRAELEKADVLLLATDEDREGEAISWHLVEVLEPRVPVKRMVFHEITKPAVLAALEATREIDTHLVLAQEARRITDRLYGYEISPILWRKIKPRLSAGRVQSVATRILVERERARMRFRTAEYWDLTAEFEAEQGKFGARLVSVDGKRIAGGKDFDPDTGKLKRDDVHRLDGEMARQLAQALTTQQFHISFAEEKPFTRTPAPPFTTSTLQQEGNRKLRFDAKRTMRAAQRLYENGFITYMRTDSVVLSDLAIELTRSTISSNYGDEYLPAEPRKYYSKVKNAQEAHEAIRPAGDSISPVEEIAKRLGPDEAKVYELVWKRTLACQMKDAEGRRMTLRVENLGDGSTATFQATGNVIDFPGFLRAYVEGEDDPNAALSERDTVLPPVAKGDEVKPEGVDVEEHHTTPPARLTEASLVKALEESGIGRPSTYASIIDTIERRDYTFKKGTALVPTFTAFAVVQLMEQHMANLIDPAFTAQMEDRLDSISRGEDEMLAYLKDLYRGNGSVGLKDLVAKKVETIDPRSVCSIPLGQDESGEDVIVRVGRYGPFVQRGESTAPVPEACCPDEVTLEFAIGLIETKARGEEPIGVSPETDEPVYVKTGRFGPYVQLGDVDPDDKKKKPKMASLLEGMTPETIDLDTALQLLALPRLLGKDPEGVEVRAYNGRYGPYIKRGDDTRSLEPTDDLLKVSLERAMQLLAQEKKGGRRRSAPKTIKVFENVEPLDGGEVKLLDGRYGPYVTDGETNASLPRGFAKPETLELGMALSLLAEQREKKGTKKKAARKKTTKKAAPKKSSSKKSTSKKSTSRKTTKKKAATKKSPSKKKSSSRKTS